MEQHERAPKGGSQAAEHQEDCTPTVAVTSVAALDSAECRRPEPAQPQLGRADAGDCGLGLPVRTREAGIAQAVVFRPQRATAIDAASFEVGTTCRGLHGGGLLRLVETLSAVPPA